NEYLKLLKFINGNNFDKYKSVVLNNLVWTYMLNNDYEKALERIDDLVNLGDDFEYLAYHKSLCLYYLGQLDAALTALNSVNEVSDRILLGKCKVLKILINGNEDEKLEKELLKQYKLIRSKSDPQTQMYYINELINFYTKNHKYKQLSKFQDIKIKLLENDSFF
ncbi:tetratricopeptide repeat protein, partial [Anaerorhabdus sp.]|uniref:tetratricopeptide repeat protein n=1 Tax=Anaerorhabdus sp. TaxID=1872524 RepID=UPI002FC5A975